MTESKTTLKKVDDHPLASDPRVNKVAKAIAWIELTDLGKRKCQWPQDWAEDEVRKFRSMAIAAMEELNVA